LTFLDEWFDLTGVYWGRNLRHPWINMSKRSPQPIFTLDRILR
jgi:hypothetical protein